MIEINCQTQEIKALSDQIFRVRLAPKQGEVFAFKGGQYLYLLMPDGKRIPLSIASAEQERRFVELHIRLIPGHQLAADMLALFRQAKNIHIEGPYGRCYLKDPSVATVIIAGGTGFSPMKSLLESAFNNGEQGMFSLYLGVQTAKELYQTPMVESWTVTSPQFRYIPVVNQPDDTWQGARGFPHLVALQDHAQALGECQFIISGSGPMVMKVYQDLLDAGVDKARIFSDMLDIKRDLGELD